MTLFLNYNNQYIYNNNNIVEKHKSLLETTLFLF